MSSNVDISLCQSTLKDLSLYCELNDAQSNKIRKCADKILQKATRQTKLQLVNTIASFAISLTFLEKVQKERWKINAFVYTV